MITIDTISKKYGKAEVLNVPSIEIPTGQSFGLVVITEQEKPPYLIFY